MVRRRTDVTGPGTWRLLLSAGVLTVKLAADLLVRALVRDRRKYRYVRNYLQDHTLHYVTGLGSLYEQGALKGQTLARPEC
jgi:hypothetical protein